MPRSAAPRATPSARGEAPRGARAGVARPPVEEWLEPPTHPGEMLMEEFLRPLGMPQTEFAARLRVPLQRLNDLIHARRGVTPDTALRLARALGTSPQFWLTLQESWDLWHAAHGPTAAEIAAIKPLVRDASGALVAA